MFQFSPFQQSFPSFPFQQSFPSFPFQAMPFGNCAPPSPISLPPVCLPMGGNYFAESQFWASCMQAQQNLFTGWQQFCGCPPQQPAPPQQPPQFGGCRPRQPEVHVHHHFHFHPPQRPAQPAPQRPVPQPIPQPPLTRTPPSLPAPTPQIISRPLPSPAPPASPNNRVVFQAHAFGVYTDSTRVGNASMHNNVLGGRALAMTSNQPGGQVTHRTSVTTGGVRF